MVKHIVMWNLADPTTKQETGLHMKELLEGLVGKVPGLLRAEVGIGFNGYDVALYSELASREALAVYQEHPAHLEVKTYVHSVISQRVCCDWEC
jgi:hypothetical protein